MTRDGNRRRTKRFYVGGSLLFLFLLILLHPPPPQLPSHLSSSFHLLFILLLLSARVRHSDCSPRPRASPAARQGKHEMPHDLKNVHDDCSHVICSYEGGRKRVHSAAPCMHYWIVLLSVRWGYSSAHPRQRAYSDALVPFFSCLFEVASDTIMTPWKKDRNGPGWPTSR